MKKAIFSVLFFVWTLTGCASSGFASGMSGISGGGGKTGACATGYTRKFDNYCSIDVRPASYVALSDSACGTYDVSTNVSPNAIAIEIEAQAYAFSGNASNVIRSATVRIYQEAGCNGRHTRVSSGAFESTALLSKQLSQTIAPMKIDLLSRGASFYHLLTGGSAGLDVGRFYILGYYD